MLDLPNDRSSHTRPTPKGAGLGIIVFLLVFIGLNWMSLGEEGRIVCLGSLFLGLIGVADDIVTLSAIRKLILQVVVVAISVAVIPTLSLGSSIGGEILLRLAFFLWLMWCINFFNFMDGINGIAIIQALCCIFGYYLLVQDLIHSSFLLFLGLLLLTILPLNFPNARIFLGDSGSLALGYLVGALPLLIHDGEGLEWVSVAIFMVLPFFLDATITLVRRAVARENVFAAHRTHCYQALALRLGKHWPVTIFYGVLGLLSALSGVSMAHDTKVSYIGGVLLCLGMVIFFSLIQLKQFRK